MIPKELTTVTPVSRVVGLVVLIILPFLGFFIGSQYQKSVFEVEKQVQSYYDVDYYKRPVLTPTVSPSVPPTRIR